MSTCEVRERVLMGGPAALSDADLLAVYGAEALAGVALSQLAWASVGELLRLELGEARATALAVAFELGTPRRGVRCLDPASVSEVMRFARVRAVRRARRRRRCRSGAARRPTQQRVDDRGEAG